jgi:hypothetical protein
MKPPRTADMLDHKKALSMWPSPTRNWPLNMTQRTTPKTKPKPPKQIITTILAIMIQMELEDLGLVGSSDIATQ